jgi:hypothetical protein
LPPLAPIIKISPRRLGAFALIFVDFNDLVRPAGIG